MRFLLDIPDEEKIRRRRITDASLKMTFLAGIAGLALELLYIYVLRPNELRGDPDMALVIPSTIVAIGMLTVMIGVNRIKSIPYWVSSTLFIVAITALVFFSDSAKEFMSGRSTMYFLVPILLSGVLVHSLAPFVLTTLITLIFIGYSSSLSLWNYFNPLSIVFLYLSAALISLILRDLENSSNQVRQEATQSQMILTTLRGGYILIDKNNIILRTNDETSVIFPLASPGKNIFDVVSDTSIEITKEDMDLLRNVLKGEKEEARVKIFGKYYFVTNKLVPSSKNRLVFLRDITAEMEIDRLKDITLAVVSHELRTPLAAMRGHAELALLDPKTAVANSLRILILSEKMSTMVENLLSQSRLRTGKIRNSPAATDIVTVFRIVYSFMAPEAKEKQLELILDVDQDFPEVMIDAVLLQQILTNLVSNAVKFTDSGKVTMTAKLQDKDHWFICVADTGPGIPMAKRTEIFKEFFQGEEASIYDRPHQGTGLGLSIVKGLVEQMGGKLSLKSAEGKGSKFTVVFPLTLPDKTNRSWLRHGT